MSYYKKWLEKHPDYHKKWRNRTGYYKKYYQKNKAKILARHKTLKYKLTNRKAAKRQREKVVDFTDLYLQSHPCADCGNNDIRVLEFDHINGDKIDCVRRLGSISAVTREIEKCVVRCANCHKIRHWKDRNQ